MNADQDSWPIPTLTENETAIDNASNVFQKSRRGKGTKVADKANTAAQELQNGIDNLTDTLLPLIDALQAVAKIHPFIEAAVSAFKVVVELNMKRRETDKKIDVLFLSMAEMMDVLRDLESLRDDNSSHTGDSASSSTIRASLESLVHQAAIDVHACANACDTYSKKGLFTKFVRSSQWNDTFGEYIERFSELRSRFIFKISLHSGKAADFTADVVKEVDEKVSFMLSILNSMSSPEQQQLAGIVERNGGTESVLADDVLLARILEVAPRAATSSADDPRNKDDILAAIKAELAESTAEAQERNSKIFERKFRLQEEKIVEELTNVTHRESDRIIETVMAGPQDRIRDPDIYEVWTDMGWRGRARSRDFALALYDHFVEQAGGPQSYVEGRSGPGRMNAEDREALGVLKSSRMYRVVEAIDIDGLGFISVQAINRFTDARPITWSLVQWVAYWAIGWETLMSEYRDSIGVLIGKMSSLRHMIRTVDPESLDVYLSCVYRRVEIITASFGKRVPDPIPTSLLILFEEYTRETELRLRRGLETVKYTIDALDTLSLIVGPVRIEENVFLLLHLLLSRDFQVFRLSRTKCINPQELIGAWHNLHIICEAISDRYHHLEDVCGPEALDTRMKHLACGMFNYWSAPEKWWSSNEMEKYSPPVYNDDEEGPLNTGVLSYPLATDYLYPAESKLSNDLPPRKEDSLPGAVSSILGRWNGFLFREDDEPCAAMYSFDFRPTKSHLASFTARGRVAHLGSEFVVDGFIEMENDKAAYVLSIRFVAAHYNMYNSYLRGTLDEDNAVLSGQWIDSSKDMKDKDKDILPAFEFRRMSQEVLICRPSTECFRRNRAAALWKFALTAVHNQVLRDMYSLRHFERRRKQRQDWETTSGGSEGSVELFRTTTYNDACYYYAIMPYRQNIHPAICDHCRQVIVGSRILCLECIGTNVNVTLDFCDKPECMGATITTEGSKKHHLPSHDMVKLRAVVLPRDLSHVRRLSRGTLARAQDLLYRLPSLAPPPIKRAQGLRAGLGLGRDARPRDTRVEPACISCGESVCYPCWVCFECEENIFVCQACESKEGGINKDSHKDTHGLVRCLKTPAKVERVDSPQARLASLEQRFDAFEARLEERMTKMEELLQRISTRLFRTS